MIVPMKKVSLIVLDGERKNALKRLRKLGLLHIEIKEGKGPRLAELKEQIASIKEQARKSSYEGIETILDGLEKAKSRLKANVNFELVMELLFLTIKEN